MVYHVCKECGNGEGKWTPEPLTWHMDTYVVRCPECGKKEMMKRSADSSRWEYVEPDEKKRGEASLKRKNSTGQT